MVKATYTFLGCLLISVSSYAAPTTLDCQSSTNNFESNLSELEKVAGEVDECPEPTKDQFLSVCQGIYNTEHAETQGFSYTYQERLWNISCAKPATDTIDVAKIKIQKMWNKHREKFRCYNYPTSVATDKNITKFSLDNGFPGFIIEAVKKYKLDMNFKDPDDQKTVLDFVKERTEYIKKYPPVDAPLLAEYERIYKFLAENGAKHSKDL